MVSESSGLPCSIKLKFCDVAKAKLIEALVQEWASQRVRPNFEDGLNDLVFIEQDVVTRTT